jgi:hypothetical protein
MTLVKILRENMRKIIKEYIVHSHIYVKLKINNVISDGAVKIALGGSDREKEYGSYLVL